MMSSSDVDLDAEVVVRVARSVPDEHQRVVIAVGGAEEKPAAPSRTQSEALKAEDVLIEAVVLVEGWRLPRRRAGTSSS